MGHNHKVIDLMSPILLEMKVTCETTYSLSMDEI